MFSYHESGSEEKDEWHEKYEAYFHGNKFALVSIFELHPRAPEYVEGGKVRIAQDTALADPAPVAAALRAGHVVASVNFFDSISALWTLANVVLLYVVSQVWVAHVSASNTWVSDCSAFEAHFLTALARCHSGVKYFADFLPLDVIQATDLGAPLEAGISLHIYVFFEFQVFLKDFLTPKLFHVGLGEFVPALVVHAADFDHLAVFDFGLEVV